MEPDEAGVEIRCRQGDALEVASDGTSVDITWETPVQLYRALSLIPQPLAFLLHPGEGPASPPPA